MVNVSCSGSITSVGEERAFVFYCLLVIMYLCGFCSENFPLPFCAWNGVRGALLWHSLGLPYNYSTGISLFSSFCSKT